MSSACSCVTLHSFATRKIAWMNCRHGYSLLCFIRASVCRWTNIRCGSATFAADFAFHCPVCSVNGAWTASTATGRPRSNKAPSGGYGPTVIQQRRRVRPSMSPDTFSQSYPGSRAASKSRSSSAEPGLVVPGAHATRDLRARDLGTSVHSRSASGGASCWRPASIAQSRRLPQRKISTRPTSVVCCG
jgi:hypothetical protein